MQGEENYLNKWIVARRQTIKKNRFKGGLLGKIFLKINTTFNTHMLY